MRPDLFGGGPKGSVTVTSGSAGTGPSRIETCSLSSLRVLIGDCSACLEPEAPVIGASPIVSSKYCTSTSYTKPELIVTSSLRGKVSPLKGRESRSIAGRHSDEAIKLTTGEILSRAGRRSFDPLRFYIVPGGVLIGSLARRGGEV
ncbi:hypothetical protein F2Q69_00035379 [Brassica cretica]|uniref:Uncharacterized protein n=1 Tax=Brassica cretica TaxID=69181 RepID=A0A8S9SS50_BRACR|nr:hypothetical protein F2Q69_00035379 [Brassica cretica]